MKFYVSYLGNFGYCVFEDEWYMLITLQHNGSLYSRFSIRNLQDKTDLTIKGIWLS